MKTFTLLILTALMSHTFLSAQKLDAPENYFGVAAGGGVGVFNSNLNVEYPFYLVQLSNVSAVFRTFENQKAALHLDFGYSERGGLSFFDRNYFGSDTVGMGKIEYFVLKTRGFELSALTHLAFGSGKSKFVIAFGPYAYYTIDKSLSSPENEILTKDLMPQKNYDLGVKGALAYSLNLKRNVFELEVKYGHGFINVYQQNRINSALLTQNQMLSLNLIYLRKLKNK